MTKSINDYIDEIANKKGHLDAQRPTLERQKAYRGRPLTTDLLRDRYVRDLKEEVEAAHRVYTEARQLRKMVSSTPYNRFRLWLRKCLHRSRSALESLPPTISSALRAERAARVAYLDLRSGLFLKYVDIGAGPLSLEIKEKVAESEWQHRRKEILKRDAINKLDDIEVIDQSLERASNWLRQRQQHFKPSHFLTTHSEFATDDLIEDAEHGVLAPFPVLRVSRDFHDHGVFRAIAKTVADAWLASVEDFRSYADRFPRHIKKSLQTVGGTPSAELPGSAELDKLWNIMADPEALDLDVRAALYWVASAAEAAMIGALPHSPGEEQLTSVFVTKLIESTTAFGKPLFGALGYGSGYPLDFAIFEPNKTTEAVIGSDFGIVLNLGLDDKTLCRAALLQTKLAEETGEANVYRKSDTHGKNHQLAALIRGPTVGYYAFFGERPGHSPTAMVVPAQQIADRLLSQHDETDIRMLPASKCKVECGEGATDLGTFFAYSLLDGRDEVDLPRAIRALSNGKEREVLKRLLIISAGRPLDPNSLELLTGMGYVPRPEGKTIASMAQDMGF